MTRLKAGNPYVFLATSQKSIEALKRYPYVTIIVSYIGNVWWPFLQKVISDTISWRYDSKTGLKTIEEFPPFRAMHNLSFRLQ